MLDRNLEDALPYLFGLLGIIESDDPLAQMDGQIKKRRTLEAIKRILLRESMNQGVPAMRWLRQVQAGAALLNPTKEDYEAAARKVTTFKDQKITLFDATLAVVAERLNLRVWTYDHHFDLMRVPVWR
jgi:hypothetical protein